MEESANYTSDQNKCGHCMENINEGAKVCHHCGRDQRWFPSKEIIAVLVGAIIGLVGAFGAIAIDNRYTQDRENRRIQAEQIAFMKAVRTELISTKDRYMKMIGEHIEVHTDDMLVAGGLITPASDFTTYYDNNAVYLGRLDNQLSLDISRTYAYIKFHFAYLMYYQKICDDYFWYGNATPKISYSEMLRTRFQGIKDSHYRFLELINATIKELDEKIGKSE